MAEKTLMMVRLLPHFPCLDAALKQGVKRRWQPVDDGNGGWPSSAASCFNSNVEHDSLSPSFVQYVNTRNFDGVLEEGTVGDVSPEGLAFIAASDSPNGKPLLAVAYEASGTAAVYEKTEPTTLPDTGGELLWRSSGLLLLLAGAGLLAAGYV
jgi:hypothetical protein